MPIAAGLAGGVALSSFDAVQRTAAMGLRTAAGAARGGAVIANQLRARANI
jgi:hypothetical protein